MKAEHILSFQVSLTFLRKAFEDWSNHKDSQLELKPHFLLQRRDALCSSSFWPAQALPLVL